MTFLQLKTDLRRIIWPDGEAETLVDAHNRSFLDALMDIQQWVECQQQDNTQIVPQCATYYKCGLTTLDAPRGYVLSLGVIDKIDPDTGLEDADAADDYCSLIEYQQVDACYIDAYFAASQRAGCCLPLFFGCCKPTFPTPTDEGLPAGLPLLSLGYHYPQSSTDRTWGRARSGVWAISRGQIFVAPWIQSTETIILRWDGLKREWADADEVDNDPLFQKAVRLYVQAQHAGEWEHEFGQKADFKGEYGVALADLIRQCREETRERGCEPSQARGANSLMTLFYNDSQSQTATCDAGTTGSPVTVTLSAGTVASAISKADANQIAQAQALAQARAQLVCVTTPVTYQNTAQTYVASCTATAGKPPPDGNPVTRTQPAGTVTSTVSQADADAQALALATAAALAALSCTYWNSEQTYTAVCTGVGTDVTVTKAAHSYSSAVSQADADAQAYNAAKSEAEAALPGVCTGAGVFHSTQQGGFISEVCACGIVFVAYTVTAGYASSNVSQADANQQANAYGLGRAQVAADTHCALNQCGSFSIVVP